jgi:FkbM family methyltransferase
MKDIYGVNLAGLIFKTSNGLLANSIEDVSINQSLGFDGSYDKEKLRFLLKLVDKNTCVYIIGAHIGTLAVPLGAKAGKVFAFEANPETFRFLSWNVSLNHLDNIRIFNYAIWDRESEIPFYQNRANTGGSKIAPIKEQFNYTYDNPKTINVPARVLDDLVAENGMDLPFLMIMDIEGAEYAALKGGGTCLSNSQYLYIEFMPHHLENVANISVDQFVEAITDHFSCMMVVEEYLRKEVVTYTGADIHHKLAEYYNRNISADLLFSKDLSGFK